MTQTGQDNCRSIIDKKAAESGMSSEEFAKKTLLEECRKMDDNGKKISTNKASTSFFD